MAITTATMVTAMAMAMVLIVAVTVEHVRALVPRPIFQ
jgi:hypothetical protein